MPQLNIPSVVFHAALLGLKMKMLELIPAAAGRVERRSHQLQVGATQAMHACNTSDSNNYLEDDTARLDTT